MILNKSFIMTSLSIMILGCGGGTNSSNTNASNTNIPTTPMEDTPLSEIVDPSEDNNTLALDSDAASAEQTEPTGPAEVFVSTSDAIDSDINWPPQTNNTEQTTPNEQDSRPSEIRENQIDSDENWTPANT